MDHKRKKLNYQLHMERNAYMFITPFFVIYFIFNLFPIISSLFLSFFEWDGMGPMNFVGLENYIKMFTSDPYFLMSIKNTVILMLLYIPVSIIAGLIMANILSSALLKCKRFFQVVNYFPYIITPVAVGLIFYILFDWSSGTVNKVLLSTGLIEVGINWLGTENYARLVVGLMLSWKNVGYCMMLYLAAIAAIPQELYEAARVDGANAIQTFRHVTLPLLRPITLFVTTTSIINGFQLFDEVKMLMGNSTVGMAVIGGPNRSCLTAVWNLYDTAFGFTSGTQRMGYGSAVAYGLFMFILLVSLINYLVTGRKDKAEL